MSEENSKLCPPEHWRILDVLEFTSDRKRMSVIVRKFFFFLEPALDDIISPFDQPSDTHVFFFYIISSTFLFNIFFL